MGIWRKNASRHWGLTMTDMSDLNKLLEKIDDEMLEALCKKAYASLSALDGPA